VGVGVGGEGEAREGGGGREDGRRGEEFDEGAEAAQLADGHFVLHWVRAARRERGHGVGGEMETKMKGRKASRL